MSKEVVKYHNDLNAISLQNWTSEEMNFFFSIIAKLRDVNTREITFTKHSLADLANYSITHNKRFKKTIEDLVNKITQIQYVKRTHNSLEVMAPFRLFRVKWNKDLSDMSMIVKVTEEFEYVLNHLNVQFTSYELAEFTSIRSKYAKTVYRLLKQWETIGKREFKISEFKLLLGTPIYYTPSEIDKNILKVVMNELSAFFKDLKVEKLKSNSRGTPVTGYAFTWKREQSERWIANKYDNKQHKNKDIVPGWYVEQSSNTLEQVSNSSQNKEIGTDKYEAYLKKNCSYV